jgi:hypothetical protein
MQSNRLLSIPVTTNTTNYSSRLFRPIYSLSPHTLFPHILFNFLRDTLTPSSSSTPALTLSPGIKQIAPYWKIRTTFAKDRWFDRNIIDVLSEEFRSRNQQYYVRFILHLLCKPSRQIRVQKYAIQSGLITVNNQVVSPDRIFRPSDRLE